MTKREAQEFFTTQEQDEINCPVIVTITVFVKRIAKKARGIPESPEGRGLNVNYVMAFRNTKTKPVRLSGRNPQEMRMKTAALVQESKDMQEQLKQLKENMTKQKEARRHSEKVRWSCGQLGASNSDAQTTTNHSKPPNTLQKLSAGKVKIRVLQGETLTGPSPPVPPHPRAPIDPQMTRKKRPRETDSGQCEVKTAVTNLQKHTSTQDVLSCPQKPIIPSSLPTLLGGPSTNPKLGPTLTIKATAKTKGEDQSSTKRTEAVTKPLQPHPDPSEVLAANHGEEKKRVEFNEESLKSKEKSEPPNILLRGEYNEEESAMSFQEALRQWREGKKAGGEQLLRKDALWTPVQSGKGITEPSPRFRDRQRHKISVSATATQADLAPNKMTEGKGRRDGNGRVAVLVEFTDNGLTYMERLLLKKHRRTPIQINHPPLVCGTDSNSLHITNPEEETANNLTAQEEAFRHYCASLFAVPVRASEPQITAPQALPTNEVLDERDTNNDGDFSAEKITENNTKTLSVQKAPSKVTPLVPKATVTSSGSSKVSCSPSSPTQYSGAPAQSKVVQGFCLSKPQNLQAEHSMRASSSKSKSSRCPTTKTPKTSETSIKIPISKSQEPNCSRTVHQSKPECESSQRLSSPSLLLSQTEKTKSSPASSSFQTDASPLACTRQPVTEMCLSSPPSTSPSLMSTFTLKPAGSTESPLLPKIYQSTSFQKGSDSSLSPQQHQFSQLFPEPILSLKLPQSSACSLESRRQFQQPPPELEPPIPVNQPQLLPSPVSSSQNLSPKSPLRKTLSGLSVFNESTRDQYTRYSSSPKNEDTPFFMFPPPISGEHDSSLSCQAALRTPSLPSHLFNSIQNPIAEKMEENEELSIDSGDEMSSDSLDLTPYEEDSSEEEAAQMRGPVTRRMSREEERRNLALHEYRENIPQSHSQESTAMMYTKFAESGSEQDGFPPLGRNSGYIYTPEHTCCDSRRSSQTKAYDSHSTGSEGDRSSSSFSIHTEEYLVFREVIDNHRQKTGIQINSTVKARSGEILANELQTIGLSSMSSPTLSRVPGPRCPSYPTWGSKSSLNLRPLSCAAQEIKKICSVDQSGCEDPDLDIDAAAHTLKKLEQELRRVSTETGKCGSTFGAGSRSQNRCTNQVSRRSVTKDLEDEEQQSVLLLP